MMRQVGQYPVFRAAILLSSFTRSNGIVWLMDNHRKTLSRLRNLVSEWEGFLPYANVNKYTP